MPLLITQSLPFTARCGWTVNDFEKLWDTGFFAPDARLELIEGEIWEKMTQKELYAVALSLTEFALAEAFKNSYVRGQQPLFLGPSSKPEPDLAVVPGTPRDYLVSHPATAELIVEISDST